MTGTSVNMSDHSLLTGEGGEKNHNLNTKVFLQCKADDSRNRHIGGLPECGKRVAFQTQIHEITGHKMV